MWMAQISTNRKTLVKQDHAPLGLSFWFLSAPENYYPKYVSKTRGLVCSIRWHRKHRLVGRGVNVQWEGKKPSGGALEDSFEQRSQILSRLCLFKQATETVSSSELSCGLCPSFSALSLFGIGKKISYLSRKLKDQESRRVCPKLLQS